MIIKDLELIKDSIFEFEIDKKDYQFVTSIYQVKLITPNNPIFIAVINKDYLSKSICNLCLFSKFDEQTFSISINNEMLSCNQFCNKCEDDFKALKGIDVKGRIIFLKKKQEIFDSEIISINKNYCIELNTLKETICSVNCCGDINPEKYINYGCWMKEENCCPLKHLLNKILKT